MDLEMFSDGRKVDTGDVLTTDLCIVGAGAAGITLARGFIGSKTRVCLLESGGIQFDQATQSLYQGRNVGLGYYPLDVCRLRYFGGSTNAWGGWCRPLDEIDFKVRPWVPDSGWPFGYEALRKYYAEAHEVCEIEQPNYDPSSYLGESGGKFVSMLPVNGSGFETTIFTFSPPTRFGARYADEIARSRNVNCLLHSNAIELRTTHNGGRVTEVDVRCLGGGQFTVRAKAFVLAAGGIENPRLLLVSNNQQPAGLGNGHGLVGRYFMEHTHTERRLLPKRRQVSLDLYGLDFARARVSARLSLTPAAQRKGKLLQYSANIKPVYFGEDSAAWQQFMKAYEWAHKVWRVDPISRLPPYELKKLRLRQVLAILAHPYDIGRAAIGNILSSRRLISHFVLQSKSEQAPNAESRVRLTTERDDLGLNRVALDWVMSANDRRTVCTAEDRLDAEFRRLDIGQLEDRPADETEVWPSTLVGGWHQLGTTRMHGDPKRGVVDAHGRVHGVENLYVAGGSVFPTCGTATPTLTVVALALRLTDHLKAAVFTQGGAVKAVPPVGRQGLLRRKTYQAAAR